MSAQTAPQTAPNRWRWLVNYILRASAAIGPLERLILRAALEHVQSIEGARVALACVGKTVERDYGAMVDDRFGPDLAPIHPPGPQWSTAVLQIAASRGGLDGMILTEAVKHVVSEEGFRVALGALRIPIDEGWVEHLRAAGAARRDVVNASSPG